MTNPQDLYTKPMKKQKLVERVRLAICRTYDYDGSYPESRDAIKEVAAFLRESSWNEAAAVLEREAVSQRQPS